MVTFFAVMGWCVLSLPLGICLGRLLKKLNSESEAHSGLATRACLSPRSSSSGGG